MKVIATTSNGCIIESTNEEINEILSAVAGKKINAYGIGQKIPAFDYAGSIRKIKRLSKDSDFLGMFYSLDDFIKKANKLKKDIEKAATIEL